MTCEDRANLKLAVRAIKRGWDFSDTAWEAMKDLALRCMRTAATNRDALAAVWVIALLDEIGRQRTRAEADNTRTEHADHSDFIRDVFGEC